MVKRIAFGSAFCFALAGCAAPDHDGAGNGTAQHVDATSLVPVATRVASIAITTMITSSDHQVTSGAPPWPSSRRTDSTAMNAETSIGTALSALRAAGASNALLAGSGSCVFTLATDAQRIGEISERLHLPAEYERFPTRFAATDATRMRCRNTRR